MEDFKMKLTADHLVPLSKGGTHTTDNIAPAHRGCNSTKKDKEWFDGKQLLIRIA